MEEGGVEDKGEAVAWACSIVDNVAGALSDEEGAGGVVERDDTAVLDEAEGEDADSENGMVQLTSCEKSLSLL